MDLGIQIIYQKTLLVVGCLCFRNSEHFYYSVAKRFVLASNLFFWIVYGNGGK